MSSARDPLSDSDQGGEPEPVHHHRAHRVTSMPQRGERGHAQEVWQALAGPLSSAAMRLRSERSQHAGGTHESRALDEIIREVFDRWVEAGCPQRLPSGTTGVEIDALLGQLSDDRELVPAPTTAALGQDSPCSYARASWLLIWARHAPDGPRCRSYRAARYFLADADPAAFPAAPPERDRSGPAPSTKENDHPKVRT